MSFLKTTGNESLENRWGRQSCRRAGFPAGCTSAALSRPRRSKLRSSNLMPRAAMPRTSAYKESLETIRSRCGQSGQPSRSAAHNTSFGPAGSWSSDRADQVQRPCQPAAKQRHGGQEKCRVAHTSYGDTSSPVPTQSHADMLVPLRPNATETCLASPACFAPSPFLHRAQVPSTGYVLLRTRHCWFMPWAIVLPRRS